MAPRGCHCRVVSTESAFQLGSYAAADGSAIANNLPRRPSLGTLPVPEPRMNAVAAAEELVADGVKLTFERHKKQQG